MIESTGSLVMWKGDENSLTAQSNAEPKSCKNFENFRELQDRIENNYIKYINIELKLKTSE